MSFGVVCISVRMCMLKSADGHSRFPVLRMRSARYPKAPAQQSKAATGALDVATFPVDTKVFGCDNNFSMLLIAVINVWKVGNVVFFCELPLVSRFLYERLPAREAKRTNA